MNKILRRCLVAMSMVLTFGFVFSGDVSALDSYVDQSTVAKAAFEGVYRCARHEAYSKNISGLTDSSTGAFGINTTGNLKEKIFTGVNESTNYVTLPYRQSSIFSETSCKAIMSGTLSASKTSDGSFSDGLKKGMMSNVMKKDVSTQKAYLKSIGYEESGDSLVFKGDDLQFTAGVAKNNDTNIKMNITDYSSLKLTEQETYNLYRYYLTNNLVYGLQPVCEGDSGYDSLSGNVKTVKLFADKKCKVNLDDAKSPGSGVYGVLFGGQYDRHFTGPTAKLDVNQVIAAFEKMDFSQINPAEFGAIDDTSDEDEDGGCQGSGAGASLGWILCPVLEVLSNAAGAMYDIVVPYLEIDTSLFVNQDEGTRFAWETFRNMANVVFIILLLIVIFSQLTGVGIDNYGIKKILPKMIVAAILINMSYLICILGVEISNIVGNGVKALFDGLPSGAVASTVDGSAGSVPINGIGNVVSVGLIVAIVGGATAAFFNPAILLSLIVTGLGILISLVFLFILLAAREAAIIVLIVISPLAFACIMLPNTKKLFDKWFKASKGLILLYPICGLMVGGGNYVSRLLISSQPNAGIASALIAMLVGIVPIFFIPTVLKGAFAAFGNIGSKISGFGDKLRGGATRGIRNTEGYKSVQAIGLARKTRMKAGLDKDYQPTAIGNLKSKIARSGVGKRLGYQALQSQRVAAANKQKETDILNEKELRGLSTDYSKSNNPNLSDETILRNDLIKARDSGSQTAMFAVIEQIKNSNMQASRKAALTREVLGNAGNYGSMSVGEKKNFLQEFGKRYGGDFLKKDYEQADWARRGGLGNDDAIHELGVGGQWAASNIDMDDMRDEDVAALAGDRLYDMMAAGVLSQAQAQRVWASNVNMDDAERLMLAAWGNGGEYLTKQQAQGLLNGNYGIARGGWNPNKVRAYTERAAENVVIEDVRLRNREGKPQQTNDLYVDHRGPGHRR